MAGILVEISGIYPPLSFKLRAESESLHRPVHDFHHRIRSIAIAGHIENVAVHGQQTSNCASHGWSGHGRSIHCGVPIRHSRDDADSWTDHVDLDADV